MARRIYFHFVPWDEFNERFTGVDLAEADKATEESDGIFFDVFRNGTYQEEEWSYMQSFLVRDAFERLCGACSSRPRLEVAQTRRKRFFAALFDAEPPVLSDFEFAFCKSWLEDFEFAFRRLMPFLFNEPSYVWKDSPVDFSPLEDDCIIHTLSPQTVVDAARIPTLDILDVPSLRTLIYAVEPDLWFARSLIFSSEVVHKAVANGQGLCIYHL